MPFQRLFSVRLFNVIFRRSFRDTQRFVVIFTHVGFKYRENQRLRVWSGSSPRRWMNGTAASVTLNRCEHCAEAHNHTLRGEEHLEALSQRRELPDICSGLDDPL